MAKTPRPIASSVNQLLARLSPKEYQRLLPGLEPIHLEFRQVLYERLAAIDYVYFPAGAVISLISLMKNGAEIEVATVGREGMVGLPVLLGVDAMPIQVLVQIPGEALRMRANALKAEAGRDTPFRRLLLIYQSVFLSQVSQTVACNGLHTVRQRCCGWLLMTKDRALCDGLAITHEFLAKMLGVRRSSVTEVLQPLQAEGLIRCSRGKIAIQDRAGLEAAACECYASVQEEYARLLR